MGGQKKVCEYILRCCAASGFMEKIWLRGILTCDSHKKQRLIRQIQIKNNYLIIQKNTDSAQNYT